MFKQDDIYQADSEKGFNEFRASYGSNEDDFWGFKALQYQKKYQYKYKKYYKIYTKVSIDFIEAETALEALKKKRESDVNFRATKIIACLFDSVFIQSDLLDMAI